jgi:hypothetical protein
MLIEEFQRFVQKGQPPGRSLGRMFPTLNFLPPILSKSGSAESQQFRNSL